MYIFVIVFLLFIEKYLYILENIFYSGIMTTIKIILFYRNTSFFLVSWLLPRDYDVPRIFRSIRLILLTLPLKILLYFWSSCYVTPKEAAFSWRIIFLLDVATYLYYKIRIFFSKKSVGCTTKLTQSDHK